MHLCPHLCPLVVPSPCTCACSDYFLVPSNYAGTRSRLVLSLGELLRKIWNPRAFKGQVSPHEFMQAVGAASARRFTAEVQADPVEFWAWLLNALHADLTGACHKHAWMSCGRTQYAWGIRQLHRQVTCSCANRWQAVA
jgi:Ubiquitin carboxyl-terminal hydrolase